ncbi:MAG: hypothetical protein WAO07_04060 [Desulfobacterales bacterium]
MARTGQDTAPRKAIVTNQTIGDALRRAIGYLRSEQLETGEFPSVIADRVDLGGRHTADSCVFVSTAILHSLRYLGGAALEPMRARTARFLRDEMIEPGIWRYWTRRSTNTIPADVDDTACVLAVLQNDLSAQTVAAGRAAIIANRNAQGWFKTWILPGAAANDVDSVVNANVAAYLGPGLETRQACTRLLDLLLKDRIDGTYWYYAHDASLYYALARAAVAFEERATALRALLRRRLNVPVAGTRSILEVALETCTLLTLGIPDSAAVLGRIERILHAQRTNGSWARYGCYAGPVAPAPRSVWFGSACLTTALCVEALSHTLSSGFWLSRNNT